MQPDKVQERIMDALQAAIDAGELTGDHFKGVGIITGALTIIEVMDDSNHSLTAVLASDPRTSMQFGLLQVGMMHVQAGAFNPPPDE